MLKDYSVGIIVFLKTKDGIKYLLLKHKQGHWSFCKGHPNAGEDKPESARRELFEETGISDIELISKEVLIEQDYIIRNPDRDISKKAEYFIAMTGSDEVKIDNNEITDFGWFNFREAKERITFEGTKQLLDKINEIIINNV